MSPSKHSVEAETGSESAKAMTSAIVDMNSKWTSLRTCKATGACVKTVRKQPNPGSTSTQLPWHGTHAHCVLTASAAAASQDIGAAGVCVGSERNVPQVSTASFATICAGPQGNSEQRGPL